MSYFSIPDVELPTIENCNRVWYDQVYGLQELEEQYSEILMRRSRAKLMLTEAHAIIIQQALEDILKVRLLRTDLSLMFDCPFILLFFVVFDPSFLGPRNSPI